MSNSKWGAATAQWLKSNLEARGTLAVTDEEYEQESREFLAKRPECFSTCIFSSPFFLHNLDRLGLAYRSTPNFSAIFLSGHTRTIRNPPQDEFPSASEDELRILAGPVYTEIDAENQTRLIKLLPGAFDEHLVCELVTHEYADVSTTYEALSYTWGKPLFTVHIRLNGSDYYVTQNLANALRFMRHSDAPRWLWIDAICINQYDSDEKSQHIQNMYQIYSQAQSTLIWLGLANEKDDVLLDQIKVVSTADDTQLFGWHRRVCSQVILQVQDSLQRFLRRPWFKRSWVRQEVAASRTGVILCSDISMNFEEFERGVRRLLDINVILPRDLASIRLETDRQAMYFARLLQQREDLNTVYERALGKAKQLKDPDRYVPAYIAREWFRLVMLGFIFRATNTRDKVYSMGWALEGPIPQGMTGDPSHGSKLKSEFHADYNIPTSVVFQNFIKATINRSRTLEPLSLFRTSYRVQMSETGLIPAWSFDMKEAIGGRTPLGSPEDVGLAEKQELSNDFVLLRLRGTVLGHVLKELPFEGDMLDLANVPIDDIKELHMFSADKTGEASTEKDDIHLWSRLCASYGYSLYGVEVTEHARTQLNLVTKRVVVCASEAVEEGALVVCAYGGYHPYILNHDPSFRMDDGQEVQVFAGPAVLWFELDETEDFEDSGSLTDREARKIGWRRWRPNPEVMNERRLDEERDFHLI